MEKIDNKIEEIMKNSGNSFHAKVVSDLRNKGRKTLICPYYNDNHTNKAREMDIIVEKDFSFDVFGGNYMIRLQLFIECKYNKNLTLFWFDDIDYESAISLITSMNQIGRNNIHHDKSHYITDDKKVAKLYASGKDKDTENEDFFKGINQILNGFIYYKDKILNFPNNNIVNKNHIQNPNIIIKLPLIICNNFDNIHRINIGEDNPTKQQNPFFQLEINYNYIGYNNIPEHKYFLIDVVDFTNFDLFIDDITKKEFESIKICKPNSE